MMLRTGSDCVERHFQMGADVGAGAGQGCCSTDVGPADSRKSMMSTWSCCAACGQFLQMSETIVRVDDPLLDLGEGKLTNWGNSCPMEVLP